MAILEKDKLNKLLHQYYVEHYGEQDTDIWYDQPAANVWVFGRNEMIITLKCHLLTGEITSYEE